MADTSIMSPTDVVDFLCRQHEQIKSEFERTLAATGEEREAAFVDLRRLLAVHETVEEQIVHPRTKRKVADGVTIVSARLQEENEAKKMLCELEKMDVSGDGFTRKLTELRDAVLEHAGHEEAEEFAKLGEELSNDELERMGRAAKLAQAIAPTRPHPGVESRMANVAAGPFAAMLDRARDAITGKG
ncbi:hemerythrin domain-containing protein [Mycobacterium sp. Marseille-P9652]|uniref:hemerythrin domain-containing protein n=1 Tax=Mycobacterium sp. Marseille-P9652 TaxID=2654950 RepID=UPI0012E7C9EA|nr:hemerythrin domain-containing protein [Mycobacterium sp. Marseille-P9652]